ncbi:phosphopantothenoylcysteine decarboxylase isoform X2 [Sminthopsis crassicaudata]|uniref:phosphopantothenoylcysteine decarboxylase isoform X2 n=1 Tax=Sminthopsis crassicaudata TaxID=9301 RepID=UPI003D6903C8
MMSRTCGSPGPDAGAACSESVPESGAAISSVKKNIHILVGATGSVAALKLPLLVSGLLAIPGMWKRLSDPVLHIDLRRWADMLVVAPLDANTLGKVASGICDNLLTSVIRAWDRTKPLLFCPAMNTAMWEHPVTAQHVEQLKGFGYIEIPCVAKKLACGDEGLGAMAEVYTILEKVKEILLERDLLHQS